MSKRINHKSDGCDQKPTMMNHAISTDSVVGPTLSPGILDKLLDDTDVLFKTASKNILGKAKTTRSSNQCNGTGVNGPTNTASRSLLKLTLQLSSSPFLDVILKLSEIDVVCMTQRKGISCSSSECILLDGRQNSSFSKQFVRENVRELLRTMVEKESEIKGEIKEERI
jgi:hypothetical protein